MTITLAGAPAVGADVWDKAGSPLAVKPVNPGPAPIPV